MLSHTSHKPKFLCVTMQFVITEIKTPAKRLKYSKVQVVAVRFDIETIILTTSCLKKMHYRTEARGLHSLEHSVLYQMIKLSLHLWACFICQGDNWKLLCFSLQGGIPFWLEFDKSLPSSVTSAWASFGPNVKVDVSRTYDKVCTMFGKNIPRK